MKLFSPIPTKIFWKNFWSETCANLVGSEIMTLNWPISKYGNWYISRHTNLKTESLSDTLPNVYYEISVLKWYPPEVSPKFFQVEYFDLRFS